MQTRMIRMLCAVLVWSAVAVRAAEEAAKSDKPAMDMKEMAAMMEKMSALNENHKLLEGMTGTWDYRNKMWMDPSKPPSESTGTCVTKAIWGGRYYHSDYTGKFDMPGADGKMVTRDFEGKSLMGYDNMKQKFFAAWVDNMATGIMVAEGTYDAGSKTFTYGAEMACPMTPSGTMKIREVVKLVDKDHYTFEWYETRDGKELKTMEISYTRRK